MLVTLRSRLHVLRLLARHRVTYLVGLLGLVVGAATVDASSTWGLAAGGGGALLGLAGCALDVRSWRAERDDLVVRAAPTDRLDAAPLPEALLDAGYLRRSGRSGGLLHNQAVDDLLADGVDVPLRLSPRRWRPASPSTVETAVVVRQRAQGGAVLLDQHKARLDQDLLPAALAAGDPVRVRRTSYFAGLSTNDLADDELWSIRAQRTRLLGTDLCTTGGRLDLLEAARVSNHIGVSTLALTRDDFLVLAQQGHRSAQSPSRLVPSGSGSADWADTRRTATLRELVVRATERELREETGLLPDQALSTKVLGYGRLVRRGGKPEFYSVTRVPVTFHEMKVRRSERPFVTHHEPVPVTLAGDLDTLTEQLERLLDEKQHLTAPSLEWALTLLLDRLRRSGTAWLP